MMRSTTLEARVAGSCRLAFTITSGRTAGRARCNAQARRKELLKPVCFKENGDQKYEKPATTQQRSLAVDLGHAFFGSPRTQSAAYLVLTSMAAATAVFALTLPSVFGGIAFQRATDPVVDTLIRGTGAALITTAAAKYTLKGAAEKEQLTYGTFKRLNLGLMLQSLACLVVLAQGISLRNPVLTGILGTMCGLGLLVATRVYAWSRKGAPFPKLSEVINTVGSLVMPQGLAPAVYALLTLMFGGMGLGLCAASPDAQMLMFGGTMEATHVFMSRVSGATMMFCAFVAFTLKDLSERDKEDSLTFQWLNTALSANMAGQVLTLALALASGTAMINRYSLLMLTACLGAFAWTFTKARETQRRKPTAFSEP